MKTSYFSSMRTWGTATLAALCLFAFTAESYAGGHRHHRHHHNHRHHQGRVWRGHHQHHHYNPYIGNRYYSYPRSGFVISFGNGYAGRGYYYGPPRTSYYYRNPGVIYYRNRGMVPSRYW